MGTTTASSRVEPRDVRAGPPSSALDRGAVPAALVFGAGIVVAVPLLYVVGDHRWFHHDDWWFLTDRDGGSISSLLRPHNEHWSTLPIIVFRVLWHAVGLTSYRPYQTVLFVAHLGVAVLLRCIMRRAGIGPWVATASALVFVVFAAGWDDIVWAFQIGLVGTLAFGLVQVMLADHDGAIDRRDWCGLVAGLAGMLCSNFSLTMLVVVALSAWWRRGARVAAFHAGTLAIIFVLWYVTKGNDLRYTVPRVAATPGTMARFAVTGVAATFEGLGVFSFAGFVVAAVTIVGLGFVVTSAVAAGWRAEHRLAVPAAMVVGAAVFWALTAYQRAGGHDADYARSSRYVYLGAALLLPAVTLAADGCLRRASWLAPVAGVVALALLLANAHDLVDQHRREAAGFLRYQRVMLATANAPVALRVPRAVHPEMHVARLVTIGWLIDAVRSGRVPAGPRGARARLAGALHASLEQQGTANVGPSCRPVRVPGALVLRADDVVRVTGGALRVVNVQDDVRSLPVDFDPVDGGRLYAWAGPLRLDLQAEQPMNPPRVCVARQRGAFERAVREAIAKQHGS